MRLRNSFVFHSYFRYAFPLILCYLTAEFWETPDVHANLEFQNSLGDQRWVTAVAAVGVELRPI